MKQDKQIKNFAKQLLQASLDSGEVSAERVDGVLKSLSKNPPRHHVATLKTYLKLVEREVAKGTAVINYAGELSSDMIAGIVNQLSAKYGRTITSVLREDPSLIAGLRVVVDCDVYDASIASSLASLETSLS
ncbi:F0F1 ATP synthase subunit delta [Candidatus Pelagisphaera phototrophica]|uniref:F0F1 ATP synthase subunit delta n=1 Tax=Candidatus Pelagisphaera phototrophica TaxID=2684113 RepID=UPI0019E466F1|nr:F0F1 ATP synthase subunit delta [Candidatus Pelagisphaera phototrophica]QXD32520.1 F0F1 ATP synthase subunit delta [Candidatus Pelagisphaera phototrophica]